MWNWVTIILLSLCEKMRRSAQKKSFHILFNPQTSLGGLDLEILTQQQNMGTPCSPRFVCCYLWRKKKKKNHEK